MSTISLTRPSGTFRVSGRGRFRMYLIERFTRFVDRIIVARTAQVEPRVAEILSRVSDKRLREAGYSDFEIARLRGDRHAD